MKSRSISHAGIFVFILTILNLGGLEVNPVKAEDAAIERMSKSSQSKIGSTRESSIDIAQIQNLQVAGTWSGLLFQQAGGTEPVFLYSFELSQNGNEVTGTSRIQIPDSDYYGVMQLTGRIEGDQLIFQENSITEQNPEPGTYWCLKGGSLDIKIFDGGGHLRGAWSDPGCAPGFVSVELDPENPPCDDTELQVTYDQSSSNYHSYITANSVCALSEAGCNRDAVFSTMLSQTRFIAPTSETSRVENCKLTVLNIPGPFGEDHIRTTINLANYSIRNYTRANHALHPGRVTRTLVESDGRIYVLTYGEGIGSFPSLNSYLAPGTWNDVDRGLIEAVSEGSQLK